MAAGKSVAYMYLFFLISTVFGETHERQPWNDLPDITGELCPNTCMWRHENRSKDLAGQNNICCSDCSCDEECGLDSNCCFPELDKYREFMSKRHSCTYANTKDMNTTNNKHYYPSYFMIDQNPLNGCIIPINNSKECGQISVAWWGSLFPVTSEITGKVYRNRKCAICHNDTNFEEWDPVQVCDIFRNRNGISAYADVSVVATAHSKACHYLFQGKGSKNNLDRKRCYHDRIDFCQSLSSFSVPDGLNISRTEIINACESGFRSIVQKYSNVFCLICSNGNLDKKKWCAIDESPRAPNSMTFLFDSKLLAENNPESIATTYKNVACKSTSSGMDESDCVPVFCPTGQMKLGNNCDFPAKQWSQTYYVIPLRLISDNRTPLDISFTHDFLKCFQIRTDADIGTCVISPWKKKWSILKLSYKEETVWNKTIITELAAVILYSESTVNPKKFIRSIGKNMDVTEWLVKVRNNTFRFSQEFCKQNPSEEFKVIYRKPVTRFFTLTAIKKTFFCEQIELTEKDFIKNNTKGILYFKTSDKYLYPNEVSFVNSARVRVCLSDAGYSRLVSSASMLDHFTWENILIGMITTIRWTANYY